MELASFLRHLMDMHGVTVRALAGLMHRGKATISDNLDGRVPSRQFVVDLVPAVVKEPRKRELDLKKALALWEAADKPPPPAPAHTMPSGGELVAHRTQNELILLTHRAMDLERERVGTHQLVLLLMRLVANLQDEADRARELPDAHARLKALQEQLHTARHELERAREAREMAEQLAARAQQQSMSLQEKLARLRAAAPPVAIAFHLTSQDLPCELQEEYFLADPDRALRTAEAMLSQGDERRDELDDAIRPADPWQTRQVGEGWLLVALILGRVLGCVLMMVGASVYYALKTWVTSSPTWLGFPDLLIIFGIALLIDPWDILWDTIRPLVLRIIGDGHDPVMWQLSTEDVLTRVMRVPWAAAASAAAVLSLATVYWWPLWILIATVPVGLGAMAYAVLGRNQPVVGRVAPALSAGLAADPPAAADRPARPLDGRRRPVPDHTDTTLMTSQAAAAATLPRDDAPGTSVSFRKRPRWHRR
nr:hypothetical protein OG999_00010 [Streptomyces sp. NBC_00886]WSY57563.1 hypothetical protein OG999_50580 [Streptomyces sp. NBC_00886]